MNSRPKEREDNGLETKGKRGQWMILHSTPKQSSYAELLSSNNYTNLYLGTWPTHYNGVLGEASDVIKKK